MFFNLIKNSKCSNVEALPDGSGVALKKAAKSQVDGMIRAMGGRGTSAANFWAQQPENKEKIDSAMTAAGLLVSDIGARQKIKADLFAKEGQVVHQNCEKLARAEDAKGEADLAECWKR